MANRSCISFCANIVALGVVILLLLLIIVSVAGNQCHATEAKDGYLIGPRYLDLDEIGQRGSYYALSECMPRSTRSFL